MFRDLFFVFVCVGEVGYRWDVQLDFVRQFKTDYVRRLEDVVLYKKQFLVHKKVET